MSEKIKVVAHLELFEGNYMRRTGFVSGYRPLFEFKEANTKISARIDLTDKENFSPGSSGIVQITFLKGIISDSYLKKGESFIISEGGKYNLGKGEIMEVITNDQ
jgi:translation elongation factor EF-Tu-like GTPase